jgi:hypothetical protein
MGLTENRANSPAAQLKLGLNFRPEPNRQGQRALLIHDPKIQIN